MTGSFMDKLHPQAHVHQAEAERSPVRYVAHTLQGAVAFVAERAHDGDSVVVADQYLAQIVESQAIGLGLSLIVEVDRSLLP